MTARRTVTGFCLAGLLMGWLGDCAAPLRAAPLRAAPLRAAPLRAATVRAAPVPSDEPATRPDPDLRFEDVTAATGIDFRGPGSKAKQFILESVSGGVALIDYDRDGWLDVFLVGSRTVATASSPSIPRATRSALWRNRGDGTFEDVSERTGTALDGWGVGVCAGDVDDDGWIDLYVTGTERNHLLRNRGGEEFDDVSKAVGLEGGGWSTGCAFADVDRDGDLDLYVARYLDLDLDDLPTFGEGEICRYREIPVQCGPRGLEGLADRFYRNDGGRFVEASAEFGLAPKRGSESTPRFGLGVTFFDADLDGWLDLYVANDTGANFFFRNRPRPGGGRTFEETAHFDGVAVSEDGHQQGSMGVAIGDTTNDGWPDLFVTNFSEEPNALYQSEKGAYWSDASFRSGLGAPSLPYVGWGAAFLDVDHDGHQDLLFANGHVYPQMDEIRLEASAPYLQPLHLYRGSPGGGFVEVPPRGPLAALRASRGLAVGDLDNDGRLDAVVTDLDAPARVLRNVTDTPGHWLGITLRGRAPRRDALGARIVVRSGVRSGEARQTRFVLSGTSYLSQHDLRQHVGLGTAERVAEVEVYWPDGTRSTHGPFAADQFVTIEQPEAKP